MSSGETHPFKYKTKAARQHPVITRQDEDFALLTTNGNKYTGDDHLPSNEELVENTYVFTNESLILTNLQKQTQWHNIIYNIGMISLGVLTITLFLR